MRATTRELTYCALFTALIAAGAFITVPLGPVPFTLQVLFVLLAGMVLGPRLATLCTAAYLALGLVAPVYAGGTSGLGVLLGPTGGYLWGFVLAALVAGVMTRAGAASIPRLVAGGLAGLMPMYVLGTVWLSAQLQLGMGAAIATGVVPFVWIDVVKAVIAAFAARSLVSSPLGLPAPHRDR